MEEKIAIIIIIAVVFIALTILLLYRRRLTRLGLKAGKEGFEVEAEMGSDSNAAPATSMKSTADVERIRQKGKRDEITIKAKKVKARDIQQQGDDNKINIG